MLEFKKVPESISIGPSVQDNPMIIELANIPPLDGPVMTIVFTVCFIYYVYILYI